MQQPVAVPGASPSPVAGAKVWLEHQSIPVALGTPTASATQVAVDILDETTTSDSNGHFEFCPVGVGTYEIVTSATAMPGTGTPFNATITTGANVAASGGPNNLMIPLAPGSAATSTATISGKFTMRSTSGSLGDNIQYAATQAFIGNLGTVQALVPEATATPSGGTEPPTATTGSCGGGNCTSTYQLGIPPGNRVIGAASTSGSGYTAPTSGSINYSVFGAASTTESSSTPSTPDCLPSKLITPQFSGTPPSPSAANLTFRTCN